MAQPEIAWEPPPSDSPDLQSSEAHVWAYALDQNPVRGQQFQALLSSEEKARAARYRFDRDRERFVVGRGWLRTMLARYAASEPGEIEFAYGPQGKPELNARFASRRVHFNLSHSGGLALLAVTRDSPIGVDVENLHSSRDFAGIAQRFFSAAETAALERRPISDQARAFFTVWTAKEAWLKATGEGIAKALDQVEVSLLSDGGVGLRQLHGSPSAISGWTLGALYPARGYVGAVAVQAAPITVSRWKWSDGGDPA